MEKQDHNLRFIALNTVCFTFSRLVNHEGFEGPCKVEQTASGKLTFERTGSKANKASALRV